MAKRSIEELAADDRREMYRLNTISHVAHNVHNERPSADYDGPTSMRCAVRAAGRSAPGWMTDRTLRTGDQRLIRSTCHGASEFSSSRMSRTSWVSPSTAILSVTAFGTSRT
ncbi:hypothetical protein PIB30_047166 [Stylosanthes scabra]|uniref:Uncharacterized protein n=1 Tax=Stylosanthes scabra TaxID=79078 RepID=A0ABU6ZFE6_9FABA|nr:hypothetical protein [Stylosanthes scabra]